MDSTLDTTTPVTLESIARQKAVLLRQIREQKEIMTDITRDIFAPVAPATGKAGALMRAFNTGMALFEGVMSGLKLMKKFRDFFGRRRG